MVLQSCAEDEQDNVEPDMGNNPNVSQNDPLEERILDANVVTSQLQVSGSTKLNTTLPEESRFLNFTLVSDKQSGFLNAGFEIELRRITTTYTGVIVQLLTEDGQLADEYYKIPRSSTNITNNPKELNAIRVRMNFTDQVTQGRFCYNVSVYNETGDVSAPQKGCVQVQSWGGYPEVAASWNLRTLEKNIDNETTGETVGKKSCESVDYTCDATDEEKEVEEGFCRTIDEQILTLRSDGTFTTTSITTISGLNTTKSEKECTPIYNMATVSKIHEGNWAYNSELRRFIFVTFKATENGTATAIPFGRINTTSIVVDASQLKLSEFKQYVQDQKQITEITTGFYIK